MKKITASLFCLLMCFTAYAEDCAIDVAVGDTLTFTPASIDISKSACSSVTVNLKHSGKIAKAAMGHNWVLAKTADAQGLAQAGWSVGLDNDYLPANDDRTIVSTKIIGGGESTTVTFSTSELDVGGAYEFFCSFVGHYFAMKGVFKVNP